MVKFSIKEKKFFREFRPKIALGDPLSRVIASLPDYPSLNVMEYREINSAFFLSQFTTDGQQGRIDIPKTGKYGETKYVITRRTNPVDGYEILCVSDKEGTLTCVIDQEFYNPDCKDLLFALHVRKSELLPEVGHLMPYQHKRDYDFQPKLKFLLERFEQRDLNLRDFMALRHDIVQIAISKLYGLNLHLGTELNLSYYGLKSKQTPDFFEVVGDSALVGDITIVHHVSNAEILKFSKYEGLIQQLSLQGKKVIPFYMVFDSGFHNFYEVLRKSTLSQVEEYTELAQYLGQLEEIYTVLLNTYPEESTNPTETIYPKVKIDPSSTSVHCRENLKTLSDEEIISKYFDRRVLNAYADQKFSVENIYRAEEKLKTLNLEFRQSIKPSHYIPIPPDSANFETLTGKYSEQRMLKVFFSKFLEDEVYSKIAEEFNNAMSDDGTNYRVFTTGQYTDRDEELKEEFHKVRKNESFEEFLEHKGIIRSRKNKTKIPYPKMLQLSTGAIKDLAIFMEQSGQDYRKTHPARERKEKTTCDLDLAYDSCNSFLNLLASNSERDWSEDFFSSIGSDHPFYKQIKQDYQKSAKADIRHLGSLYCYKYLRYTSLLYEQLIHYSNLSMSKKRFAIFNSGLPNICCVMRCGYRGMAQQVGKPFMFMGFTKSREFLGSNMFGKLHVEEYRDGIFYFRTRWFRLPTFRLEFFRDQYYSILASTMATLARVRNVGFSTELLKGTFCVRTLIGLMANQKAMEKLADSRYAIMSSFSTHTNFEELLEEKFAPPYKSCVEGWIVMRLLKNLPKFREDIYESNNIKINTPVLDHLDRRFQQSTGGRFTVKAIWSDRIIYSLQDLLDELFLYVHTPKEPSTAFHEEVNAIKTIQKFEKLFNGYTFDEKCGIHSNPKEWLLSKPQVGFDRDFLFTAAAFYRNTTNIDLNRIERMIETEHLGELTSTKSVIPDVTRKIKPLDKFFKYRVEGQLKRHGKLTQDQMDYIEDHKKRLKDVKGRTTSEVYHGRTKVHDEIITYLSHYDEPTVLKNALHYMTDPEAEVLTDICIKAQYGAKREFYVMNMGAKVMARVVEDFYKEIAKKSPTEMISVAGDRKLISMQNMMDRTIKHAMANENIVSYCNGDCTKWSASETLEAFHVLTDGICLDWDSDFKEVLHTIIHMWTRKSIQIPLNIVSKVLPLGAKTDYVITASKNNYKIPSTQNFLQGVFNYMSSVKADVCNRYTCHLWNKFFGENQNFYVEYLVHSDDYVFAFSAPDLSVIEEFRAFHKVCMKLCGITDSSKKTNVQPIFMEFISLVCFNGSMAYPTIKKTKEVATTLPCESFSGDSDMVCSRTGECVRVGVDHYSAWVFHRIHMSLLRRAYSLHEGGENYIEDAVNKPVQVFGQSDMHPIFYFLCKGDPNNSRIFNYTKNKELLRKLYTLSQFGDSLKAIHSSFKEPTFIYNNYTQRIAEIRKNLDLSVDSAMKFWEENLVYNFIKPRKLKDLKTWLKAMYYKSSFIKAYNRDTRTTRLLRLSMFSKGKCVTYKTDDELNDFYLKLSEFKDKRKRQEYINEHMFTIKELCQQVIDSQPYAVDDRDVQISILMGDSTPDLMYSWADNAIIKRTNKINTFNTCATYSPYKASWLNVSQSADHVMCYGVDEDLFLENFGLIANVNSVRSDFLKLDKALPGVFELVRNKSKPYAQRMKALQVAYNMYTNNLPKFQVCMSSKRHRQNTVDFLVDSFKYSANSVYITEVSSKVIHLEMNPYTLERYNIMGEERSLSPLKIITHNMCLTYIYLVYCLKLDRDLIVEIIGTTKIEDFGLNTRVSTYFKLKDYKSAKEEGLEYLELLCFAFLKKLLFNDNEPLFELSKNRQFFNYMYIRPQVYNAKTRCYEGDMLAHYNFENANAIVEVKGGNVFIRTDTKQPSQVETAALIGLKLSGRVKDREFYRYLSKPSMSVISSSLIAKEPGFYAVCKDSKCKLEFIETGEEYFGLPCKFDHKLKVPRIFNKQDAFFLNTNYQIFKNAVIVGGRKLFTMPYKNLHYTPMNITTDFQDIALYNDLLPFFVLGKSIHEEHDVLELIQFWCNKQSQPVEPKIEELSERPRQAFGDVDFDDIEFMISEDNDFDPYNFDYDQDEDILQPILAGNEYDDLIEDEEPYELEQSPWQKFTQNIELIDRSSTVIPIKHSIKELEEITDHVKSAIIELCGLRETYFVTPIEYMFIARTIGNIKNNKQVEWLIPYALFLEQWLQISVKVSQEFSSFGRFYVKIVNHVPKVYVQREIVVMGAKQHNLKNKEGFICETNYDNMDDFDYVTYYKEIPQSKLWKECRRFDPLPFYPTKKDKFYRLLQAINTPTLDL